VRNYAAKILGEIQDPRAVQPLIAAFEDEEYLVWDNATEALGKIGEIAIYPLIASINHSDYRVRKGVAKSLGMIGDTRAVEPLITMLRDGIINVRLIAADALDKIGWKPDRGEKEAWYWFARRELMKCAEIGALAIEPLITALKDTDMNIRTAAADALDKIGWKPDRGEKGVLYWFARKEFKKCAEIGTPAIKPLISSLKETHMSVRKAAVDALDEIGWKPDRGEKGALYWLAKREFKKCAGIGAPAVEPLIAELENGDTDVRRNAAEALGQIGDPRATEPLSALLKSGYESVRQAATEALGKLGKPSVTSAMQTKLGPSLDAIVIVFNRDFPTSGQFVNEILDQLTTRGRTYQSWMHDGTPVRIKFHPNAQDQMTAAAIAMVEFHMLIGERADPEKIQFGTFEGSQGIVGSVLSHWQ
jgi:HEAT repeat protein